MNLPAGVYPAMVTPFDERGRIDAPGVARLLAHFGVSGCQGVVVAGTNGEGPSLSAVEKRDLVRTAVPLAQGRPVILGVATPSLDEATWLARHAGDAGAAAVLLMPPGFYRDAPTHAITAWFAAVLERSPVPVLLYNYPQRAGIALADETIQELREHPRFAGLKDSSGSRENLRRFADLAGGAKLFLGDETLLLDALANGWTGTISGAANSLPRWLAAVVADPDTESQWTKFELIRPVLERLRTSPQPMTHKAVLSALGVLDRTAVRLPLTEAPREAMQPAVDAVISLSARR